MIENKELPSEYVSIRQMWLKRIDDCGKAIGQQAINEATREKHEDVTGAKTVTYTVKALHHSLVDYGEALVRTDIEKWYKEYFIPKSDEIWYKKEIKEEDYRSTNEYRHVKQKSYQEKWWDSAKLCIKLYDQIIQVLNKYGMLFQEQPQGYSNVIMEEIMEGEKEK